MAFNTVRHAGYFKRCLKTLLPREYTSSDGSRVMFAFFTLAALDLLGQLESVTTAAERASWIEWVYGLQHPAGGFRAFTGTMYQKPDAELAPDAADYDLPTGPGTYFALASLVLLGDDLGRVNRTKTLDWLASLQASDGSVAEMRNSKGPTGHCDPRFAHTLASARWILGGDISHTGKDIDTASLLNWIGTLQGYDGGIGNFVGAESHAGFGYCAANVVSLVNDLRPRSEWTGDPPIDVDGLTRWAAHRLTQEIIRPEDAGDEFEPEVEADGSDGAPATGFCGRVSKVADTCYAFWVPATLAAFGRQSAIASKDVKKYLLERTQSQLGGFVKCAGDTFPDLYHSYLGLAALAILNEDLPDEELQLKKLNAALCVSERTVERIRVIRNQLTAR